MLAQDEFLSEDFPASMTVQFNPKLNQKYAKTEYSILVA